MVLDGPERSWTILNGPERSWMVLNGPERSWTVLDGLGRSWSTPGPSEPLQPPRRRSDSSSTFLQPRTTNGAITQSSPQLYWPGDGLATASFASFTHQSRLISQP